MDITGSCGYAYSKAEFIRQLMKPMFEQWPEYSGDINYPVPHKIESSSLAFANINKWSGEYGESRKRLLNFLKETCRIALKMK